MTYAYGKFSFTSNGFAKRLRGVCKEFGKCLQGICKRFEKRLRGVCKGFEKHLQGFVRHLQRVCKAFEKSLRGIRHAVKHCLFSISNVSKRLFSIRFVFLWKTDIYPGLKPDKDCYPNSFICLV